MLNTCFVCNKYSSKNILKVFEHLRIKHARLILFQTPCGMGFKTSFNAKKHHCKYCDDAITKRKTRELTEQKFREKMKYY